MDATNKPVSSTDRNIGGSSRRRARRLVTGLVMTALAATLAVAGFTSTTGASDAAFGPASSKTSWRLPVLDGAFRGSTWAARLPGSLPPSTDRGSSWS